MSRNQFLFIVLISLFCVYGKFAQYEYLLEKKSGYLNSDSAASSNYQMFTQNIDHFDPLYLSTFQQRYCSNWTFYEKNDDKPSPIILYISGEAPMGPNTCSHGEKIALASKFKGVIYSLEHRFYGESLPFNDLTVESLKYLTSQQAQEDLVNFITSEMVTQKFPDNTPIIIVGGSYAGAMSSWMRAKYPHLITMSWASSGPVHATEDFYQYDFFVGKTLGISCSSAIRRVFDQIEMELYASEASNAAIRSQFKGGEYIDTDPVRFLYIMADIVAFAAQYNYTEHLCPFIDHPDQNALGGFINYSNWLFDYFDQDCRNYDLPRPSTAIDKQGSRQWLWQSCNEFGFWQVAAPGGLRSKRIDLAWHHKICKDSFEGIKFTPRIERTNNYYGSLYTGASRIVFTNGKRDPWRALSLTETDRYESNNDIHSFLIEDGAHCSDLHDPTDKDDSNLKYVRSTVEDIMQTWLELYYKSH
eukprot:TRINITY_DN2223_c0_g1_i1.p1 TRINITY_DN2223_c0_g1~~TRINITY_DN2223_c0_g1_i1.p1  ORF type:complete len:487 (-),score=114.90 TRINITY_DN2223_c0_g1_i1:1-1416(-)